MAAVVSVGIHGWRFVLSRRVGSRGAAHRCVGSFALWRPHKERPRAQLFASDAQQLAASSTALWQPGLGSVPKQKLESKKLVGLASCKGTSN